MSMKAKELIRIEKNELKVIPNGYECWRNRYVTNDKPDLKNYGIINDSEVAIQFAKWIILGKLPKTEQKKEHKRMRVKKEDRIYIFSNKLKILRELAGLTMLDVQNSTDISRAYICEYEKKKLKADITTIKTLADFFKVDHKTLIEKKVEHNE